METPLTSSLTAETSAAVVEFLSAIEPSPSAPAPTKKAAAPKKPKVITYSEIREKIRNIKGGRYGGQVLKGASAEVLPGQFIRIFGVWHNRRDPVAYDLTVKIGDEAVYKSANFPHKGNIAAIGDKTVTIRSEATIKRLDLAEFTALNWNYSSERVAKRQAEWLD